MEEKPKILKNKKLVIIAVFVLLVMVVGVTYAFFNYTRTGTSNTASVGRIYFNTDQANDTLTLTNVFPSNSVPVGADSVSVHIVGDTAYFDGEEYQITLVNVVNTINAGTANEKTVPINYVATYTETTNKVVGSQAASDYYTERTANVYDLTATGVVEEGVEVLKGYIAPNATGIDGTLTIKAYLDASKVVISDTYPESTIPSEVSGETYRNGTTSSYVGDKVVLTTSEWNALQGNSTLSFKIKAEANEGKWLEPEVADEPICPGPQCVYKYTTSSLYYEPNGTTAYNSATSLQVGDYDTDYNTTVTNSTKPYFLGFILENGTYGKIVKAYACGINANNNNAVFCLEGTLNDFNGGSAEARASVFTSNVGILNTAFPGCGATDTGSSAGCSGSVSGSASASGSVDVYDGGVGCGVRHNGLASCY